MTRIIRRVLVVAGSLVALVVLFFIAGLPVYVFPPVSQTPARADLVYVIGPPTAPRLAEARELIDDGVAPELLVSTAGRSPSAIKGCAEPRTFCEAPSPLTTKGEALMLADFTAGRRAGETVVITRTSHVARTRYVFEKCYPGQVTVLGVDENLTIGQWMYEYVYQTAAFVRAWATPCNVDDE